MRLQQSPIFTSVYIQTDPRNRIYMCAAVNNRSKSLQFWTIYYLWNPACFQYADIKTGNSILLCICRKSQKAFFWLTCCFLGCPVAWCVTYVSWGSLISILVEDAIFLTISTIDLRYTQWGAEAKGNRSTNYGIFILYKQNKKAETDLEDTQEN